jgi:iduronate 2-sulfatase
MKRLLTLCVLSAFAFAASAAKQPNILFIAIDDLRPELGSYGSELAVTPNLDALAQSGVRFERAYCQQAICSPSRASLMTGARPNTIGVIENYTYFRDANPDIVTLPQHLIANGYETVYAGKIYHGKFTDGEKSWSRQPSKNKLPIKGPTATGDYGLPENRAIAKQQKEESLKYPVESRGGLGQGPAYEGADVPDNAFIDGYNTDLAIATLQDLVADKDQPFFLALGLVRPHLNWVSPQKYWDLYDRTKITLATQTEGPENGAEMGLHASFELRTRYGIPKDGPIDDELAITLRHAYLACISYVDAQIGRMLAALDEAGVSDDTIVVLWSDHGWHLGDMGIWGKATNYEIGTRVVMMMRDPKMPAAHRGAKSDALVELVDIYPTLCELTGITIPSHVEGLSFAPLLQNPAQPWKRAAFSQFPNPALREWAANPLSKGSRETFFGPLIEKVEARIIAQQGEKWDRDLFENRLMGYAMRTDRHRFVIWKDYTDSAAEPVFLELYDHQTDPAETKNIATQNPDLVAQLLAQFNTGWKGNLPPSH